jgi:hypothetical protein
MVVGEHQAIGRDERGGTARQPHRGHAYAVQPGGVDVDVVLLPYLRRREIVMRPHALVGERGTQQRQGDQQGGQQYLRQGLQAHARLRPVTDEPL